MKHDLVIYSSLSGPVEVCLTRKCVMSSTLRTVLYRLYRSVNIRRTLESRDRGMGGARSTAGGPRVVKGGVVCSGNINSS